MLKLRDIYKELVRNNIIQKEYKTFDQYSTDRFTSKMWITPKGKIINLDVWHHEYIINNAKKLKIPITRTGEDVRLDAIDVGWFRVNFVQKSGTMTVEGKRDFFTQEIKDAIFGLIARNIKNIWEIEITLLDDEYNTMARGEASLFRYDDEEKLEHIPLITESVRRKYGLILKTKSKSESSSKKSF